VGQKWQVTFPQLCEVATIKNKCLTKNKITMKENVSNEKQNEQSCKTGVSSSILLNTETSAKIILPLEMRWKPKEDITTYELAKCLPYLLRYNGTMPYEIDKSELHFRHFEIIDHNR
jgi:hypothetical protein